MIPRWQIVNALIIITGCIFAAAQTATFSVKTNEVRVDVLVTDDGKPVADLREADFEVRDFFLHNNNGSFRFLGQETGRL